MAEVSWPSSPTNGQTFTPANGSTYTYNSTDNTWRVTSSPSGGGGGGGSGDTELTYNATTGVISAGTLVAPMYLYRYLHVRFSANSNGSSFVTNPSSVSGSTIYIGIANRSGSTAPTNNTDYNWTSYTWSGSSNVFYRSVGGYNATFLTSTQTSVPNAVRFNNGDSPLDLDILMVNTGNMVARSVDSDIIAINGVAGDNIIANSIVAGKIAANAVTTDKINAGAITAAKIATGTITTTQINFTPVLSDGTNAPNSLRNNQITIDTDGTLNNAGGGQVNLGGLGAGDVATLDSIDSDHLDNNAVTTTKIDANAVTTAKIAANAVTATQIAANTITADQIASGTITTSEINFTPVLSNGTNAPNSILNNQITLDSDGTLNNAGGGQVNLGGLGAGDLATLDVVDSDQIAANAITSTKIDANAVTAPKIAANAVTAAKIAANTITAAEIASGTITTTQINFTPVLSDGTNAPDSLKNSQVTIDTDGTLNNAGGGQVNLTGLGAGNLATRDTVSTSYLENNAVTSTKISSNAVTTAKIAANAVTASEIAANTITATQINSDLGVLVIGADDTDSETILRSHNFSEGSSGWRIRGNGNAEFGDVTIRGSSTVESATIGTETFVYLDRNPTGTEPDGRDPAHLIYNSHLTESNFQSLGTRSYPTHTNGTNPTNGQFRIVNNGIYFNRYDNSGSDFPNYVGSQTNNTYFRQQRFAKVVQDSQNLYTFLPPFHFETGGFEMILPNTYISDEAPDTEFSQNAVSLTVFGGITNTSNFAVYDRRAAFAGAPSASDQSSIDFRIHRGISSAYRQALNTITFTLNITARVRVLNSSGVQQGSERTITDSVTVTSGAVPNNKASDWSIVGDDLRYNFAGNFSQSLPNMSVGDRIQVRLTSTTSSTTNFFGFSEIMTRDRGLFGVTTTKPSDATAFIGSDSADMYSLETFGGLGAYIRQDSIFSGELAILANVFTSIPTANGRINKLQFKWHEDSPQYGVTNSGMFIVDHQRTHFINARGNDFEIFDTGDSTHTATQWLGAVYTSTGVRVVDIVQLQGTSGDSFFACVPTGNRDNVKLTGVWSLFRSN